MYHLLSWTVKLSCRESFFKTTNYLRHSKIQIRRLNICMWYWQIWCADVMFLSNSSCHGIALTAGIVSISVDKIIHKYLSTWYITSLCFLHSSIFSFASLSLPYYFYYMSFTIRFILFLHFYVIVKSLFFQ